MLLFRRTTLLGTIILLPILFNILLIDIFYAIPAAATWSAALYCGGLLFLLLLHWKEIRMILFRTPSSLPAIQAVIAKNIARVLGILLSLLFVWYVYTLTRPSMISGKWKVDQIIRNGNIVEANAWLTDKTAWKNVYFENYKRVTFSPNPYIAERDRIQNGDYAYDSSRQQVMLHFHGRKDTIISTVHFESTKKMIWKINDKKDIILLHLSKADID